MPEIRQVSSLDLIDCVSKPREYIIEILDYYLRSRATAIQGKTTPGDYDIYGGYRKQSDLIVRATRRVYFRILFCL